MWRHSSKRRKYGQIWWGITWCVNFILNEASKAWAGAYVAEVVTGVMVQMPPMTENPGTLFERRLGSAIDFSEK